MWVEKDWVLVLVGVGGRAGGAGRRKEGLLGGGRGWKVKTGEEGEDSGEDIREDGEEEKVDGETGESSSEPEREEEEPETNTHTRRAQQRQEKLIKEERKWLELFHTITLNPTYLD